MRDTPLALVVATAGVLAACSDSAPPPFEPTRVVVRDSAGIEIVENPGGVRWLDLRETLRIGEVDGQAEYLFQTPTMIAVDAAGQIAVADWGAMNVRVFDAEGGFVGSLGRSGDGPAEFPRSIEAVAIEDSLVAVVSGSGRTRITLFRTDGSFVESGHFGLRGCCPHIQLAHGGLGVWAGRGPLPEGRPRGTVVMDYWDVHTVDLTADTLGEPEAVPRQRKISAGTTSRAGHLPMFEPRDLSAPGPDGTIVVSSPEGYELAVLGPGRTPRRIVRRGYDPVLVDDEADDRLQDAIEVVVADLPPSERDRATANRQIRKPRVSHIPPVRAVRVGPDGSIWVRRVDLDHDPIGSGVSSIAWTGEDAAPPYRAYDVIGPDGRYAGTVKAPSWPAAVGADWVVDVVRDELGVPYVVRYALEPAAGG